MIFQNVENDKAVKT